jgi:hypothetical protein
MNKICPTVQALSIGKQIATDRHHSKNHFSIFRGAENM